MSRRSDAPKARRAPRWSIEQHAKFTARKRYELALLLGKGDACAGLRLLLACERQAEPATLPAADAAPARAPRKRSKPAADAAPATLSRQRRSAARSAKHHAVMERWRTLLCEFTRVIARVNIAERVGDSGERVALRRSRLGRRIALTFADAVRSARTPTPPARRAIRTADSAGSVGASLDPRSGASPEPRSVGKKSKNERAPRALTTPESGVATGTASDVYSAGSESEWLPAPSRRRSAKMRRSGGAPHVR